MSLLLLAAPSLAQSVVYNPTRIQFDSPDHATVSAYVVEYWLATTDPATGTPIATYQLAKTAVTPTGTASPQFEARLATLLPTPTLVVGTAYVATLAAVGVDPTQVSPRSTVSNPFAVTNAPRTPAAVSIR